MKYLNIILTFHLFLLTFNYEATELLEICLNPTEKIHDFTFVSNKKGYCYSGTCIDPGKEVSVFVRANSIIVKNGSKEQSFVGKVIFKRSKWGANFKLKSKSIEPGNIYPDHLEVRIHNGSLKLINKVYIEHYVSGVVEAEAGSKQNNEYYKVQSLICRTYALSNLRRHEEENYHLCNSTHCQVYRGVARFNNEIAASTYRTKGLVLVDSNMHPITASFHSNCGGQTANSEDVWTYSVNYLRSVCDTFCTDQHHSSWKKEIHLDDWLNYFSDKFHYPIQHLPMRNILLTNRIDERTDIELDTFKIRAKDIRNDWQLPSAYFDISLKTDSIHLEGYGFGHGVGLCQEGAMKMSQQGYTFHEILRFYFKEINIVNKDDLTTLQNGVN